MKVPGASVERLRLKLADGGTLPNRSYCRYGSCFSAAAQVERVGRWER